jgi:hypothetical protein
LARTNESPTTRVTPTTALKSLARTAAAPYAERPGHENTTSTRKAFSISDP